MYLFLHLDEDSVSVSSFGSKADLCETPIPSWVQLGVGVHVLCENDSNKSATVRFIGTTVFAPGNWVGVELDTYNGESSV